MAPGASWSVQRYRWQMPRVKAVGQPGGYNAVQVEPHMVWTKCKCGWASPKRVPGSMGKMKIIFTPFKCPDCEAILAVTTIYVVKKGGG